VSFDLRYVLVLCHGIKLQTDVHHFSPHWLKFVVYEAESQSESAHSTQLVDIANGGYDVCHFAAFQHLDGAELDVSGDCD
jgi:hypothetical protein